MTDEEFDALMARAANPALIPGIYNYCDRRCERCRFAKRCFSYLESSKETSHVTTADDEESAGVVRRSLEGTLDALRIIAERHGIDLSGASEEHAAIHREHEETARRAIGDPIVALSKQYVMTAWPITRALWPIVMPRGDDRVIEALETIESLASTTSAKVFRAVWGTLQSDFDATDVQSDANGSAKVARLLIDESRRAWRVLMERGRATADGVPARLVNMLDQLDAAVAVRFPRAMEFTRPGFDTEPVGAGDDLDPALAVAPVGHA
jgi:hypothetical protein